MHYIARFARFFAEVILDLAASLHHRRRTVTDQAASTSSVFTRPKQSLRSTTTAITAGSDNRRTLAQTPFNPDPNPASDRTAQGAAWQPTWSTGIVLVAGLVEPSLAVSGLSDSSSLSSAVTTLRQELIASDRRKWLDSSRSAVATR